MLILEGPLLGIAIGTESEDEEHRHKDWRDFQPSRFSRDTPRSTASSTLP